MQVEGPVQRGIAAADDQEILVAELLHLAHGIKHRGSFIGLDTRHWRALRLERPAAGGDDNHLALEYLTGIGRDAKAGIADFLDRLHHLVEMEGRIERLDLLHQRRGQALAGDERNARNVVDRLFRIELGALAADLVENVDKMRFHVEQAQFEYGKQSTGTGANNQHIGFDRFAHRKASSRLNPAIRPGVFWLRLSSQRRRIRKAINRPPGVPATPCRSWITGLSERESFGGIKW